MAALPKSQPRRGFFRRPPPEPPANVPKDLRHSRIRVLTASAQRLDLADKLEARRVRMLRQGWQETAYDYADTTPEIRFAMHFLGNCASRMRLFPAMPHPDDPDGMPVPLKDIPGVPPEVLDSAQSAMDALGVGRLALASLMENLAINFGITGEAYMLGMQNPGTGYEEWTIRSMDEIVPFDDTYKLREAPLDPAGTFGWIDLPEETTFISRLWIPHPRYRLLADSAMRPLLDSAEELAILSRQIRATGRSRSAGNGFLLIPDDIEVAGWSEDNEDPEADDFIAQITEAMMTPIADEGVASAVVPIVLRGNSDSLKAISHLYLQRPGDEVASAQRAEAIGRIATGLDLPKSIILGETDANHWSLWQVDDSTWRYHLEPGTIKQVDALSVGYLRPWLQSDGVLEWWWRRISVWYDPTELVTHPDRTQDALALYNLRELSGETLRSACGFTEDDKPSPVETVTRAVSAARTYPPNALLAILARLDPSLSFPPILAAGTFPGIKAGEVDVPPPPEAPVPAELPPPEATDEPGPPAPPEGTQPRPNIPSSPPNPAPPAVTGPPPAGPPTTAPTSTEPESFAARVPAKYVTLSRKLSSLDVILRSRLHAAACASMVRALERAGARLRTQVRSNKPVATRVKDTPAALVAATLGEPLVAAMGLTPSDLVGSDWSDLRESYRSWVAASQAQALRTATKITGQTADDPAVEAASQSMSDALDASWAVLARGLTALAEKLLYAPGGVADPATMLTIDPTTVVPAGLLRAALAVAGGAAHPTAEEVAMDPTGATLTATLQTIETAGGPSTSVLVPVGQIGSGDIVSGLIGDSGGEVVSYTWVHGGALHPFEPHEDLDDVEFTSWDDPVLANDGDFPDTNFFFCGDHAGDSCDFVQTWSLSSQGSGSDGSDGGGD